MYVKNEVTITFTIVYEIHSMRSSIYICMMNTYSWSCVMASQLITKEKTKINGLMVHLNLMIPKILFFFIFTKIKEKKFNASRFHSHLKNKKTLAMLWTICNMQNKYMFFIHRQTKACGLHKKIIKNNCVICLSHFTHTAIIYKKFVLIKLISTYIKVLIIY